MQDRFREGLARLSEGDPLDIIINQANRAFNGLADSRAGTALSSVRNKLPSIQELNIPTPFGRIKTPEFSLPDIRSVQLDQRKRDAIKAAVGSDLAQIIALIPGVGDIAADIIEDTFGEKIRESMTPEQYANYMRHDKLGPSTVAVIRTFTGL